MNSSVSYYTSAYNNTKLTTNASSDEHEASKELHINKAICAGFPQAKPNRLCKSIRDC
jgi:hypothetical protein